MHEIAIRCPETLLPVRTGKPSTKTSFFAMSVQAVLEKYPSCGKPHEWNSADAWLIDAEPTADALNGQPS